MKNNNPIITAGNIITDRDIFYLLTSEESDMLTRYVKKQIRQKRVYDYHEARAKHICLEYITYQINNQLSAGQDFYKSHTKKIITELRRLKMFFVDGNNYAFYPPSLSI